MVKHLKTGILKAGMISAFLFISLSAFSQDAYMNLSDTMKTSFFPNFIGVKFFATGISATSVNQDLQFQYTSNNLGYIYKFQHDMNVRNLNNFYNVGIGLEENLGKHLSINFLNTSIGYMQNMWDWNIGAGAGYFISLNKQKTMRLNLSMNVYFESLTYNLGSYYDTTLLGFIVNGTNVGTSIKDLHYVNDIWSLTPGVEFLYRRSGVDFFAGVYYNYVFSYNEKVNFYRTSLPVSDAIYYPNSTPVSKNVANLGKYIIQIGIMKEFGI